MKTALQFKQRGMSFIGLLFVAAVLAATGVVVAQAIPTFIEYQAVIKAVNKASQGSSIPEIRVMFDKAASVESIKSISGKEIEIAKENDKWVVSFAYQREIHLAGPAYLTLKYAGRSR